MERVVPNALSCGRSHVSGLRTSRSTFNCIVPAEMVEFYSNLHPVVQGILKGLAVIMVIFPIGGACSMAERKVSAWIQGRPGPNRAIVPWAKWIPILGPLLQRLGIFHVMADGGKMLFKEDALPGHVNKFYFVLAPIVAMIS